MNNDTLSAFTSLLKNRRAIRAFENKPIPRDLIHELLQDCCLAPSSGNAQPSKFIVITNQDLIARLSDECKRNLLAEVENNPAGPLKRFESLLRNENHHVFWNAPCLIFLVGNGSQPLMEINCALAASYLMFAATARGLGTCYVGAGTRIEDDGLLAETGVVQGLTIIAPIVVGYPKAIPDPPPRKNPEIIKEIS